MRARTHNNQPIVFRWKNVEAIQATNGGSLVLLGGEWLHINVGHRDMFARWVDSGYIQEHDVIEDELVNG